MRTDLEVAEVRATAELELQTRLLEAKQQEMARREAAAAEREAAAAAEQERARKTLAAAQEQQTAAERAMEEAERVVAQQRQQLEMVRGTRHSTWKGVIKASDFLSKVVSAASFQADGMVENSCYNSSHLCTKNEITPV